MVSKSCIKASLTKMTIFKGTPIMHFYRTSHGGELNENDNFGVCKLRLTIHGYNKLHGAELNEQENYKEIHRDII